MGVPRTPKPVALTTDSPAQIGEAIYLSIRKWGPHVPVHVFVRDDGGVYALRQCYQICAAWEMKYPDSFAGSYTRKASAEAIADDMAQVVGTQDGKTAI
jgi:hypothetical protein